jgi:hypothetical protein
MEESRVKRISMLALLLLALVAAACSSDQASPSAEASEPAETAGEPSAEPTEDATPDASASASAGGGIGTDTALLDLLPDEVGGQSRTDVDLTTFPAFTAALQAQNIDTEDVEYVISTWGSGDSVVTATAMRIPGLDRVGLETMARMMTGAADGEGSAEVVTVGGKEVIAVSARQADQVGYMYFTAEGVFIIGSPSEDLAAEVLSALP